MPNLSTKQQVRRDLVFAAATARTTKRGRPTGEPDSEFHAKVMGETITLCGQDVLSSFSSTTCRSTSRRERAVDHAPKRCGAARSSEAEGELA